MNVFIKLRLALIAQTINAIILRNNGVTMSYHLNFDLKCQAETYRLSLFLGSTINQCIRECGLRKQCDALNFWRLCGLCELFSSAEAGAIGRSRCIHVLKQDIDITETPCASCNTGKACDIESKTCEYKECANIDDPEHGKIFGNLNKIGAARRQNCKDGYKLSTSSGSLVCNKTGQWNVTECVEDCVPLNNYTGTLRVTKGGHDCQRWDTNIPHTHIFDSDEYFPDNSVTEAENFCRSADYPFLWCYTTDPDVRWETCDTPDGYC